MNTAIRILTSSSNTNVINTPEEALNCLATLLSNVKDTRQRLIEVGLIKTSLHENCDCGAASV